MTLEELNAAARDGSIDEIIRVAEARQVKALSKIADAALARADVRFVLLAGASSAGKTTTAKRLCTQLRVEGREATLLSTDDYFVGDALNPRDENGELDYEHFDCVDRRRLADDMRALLAGRTIPRRRFDFVRHEGYDAAETMRLASNGIVVIEGIHALNPRLAEGVDPASIFRVFIEPRATVDLFLGIRPAPRDTRFLRRLVRDNAFRKVAPAETLALWPKVLAGEARWIDPFRTNADAEFDSGLVYEFAVLKPYVGGILERLRRESGESPEVMRMLGLLEPVLPVNAAAVPGDSILRETIGGSQLDY